MENHFELIVVGAGPGGYVAAIKAAKLGLSVAVVEEREVGGTCLNRGCIPAKAMIHAATLYEEMKDAEQFGIIAENVHFDYEKIIDYKQETINQLVGGVEQLFKGNGVTLINGRGVLHANKTVQVTAADGTVTDYTADNIILAAGSKPVVLNIPGMKLPGVISSDELFKLRERPDSIAIIGGGVIGVEFANAFSYFGTQVTIIEGMDRILPNMDREISQNLKMIMKNAASRSTTTPWCKDWKKTVNSLLFISSRRTKTRPSPLSMCSAPSAADQIPRDSSATTLHQIWNVDASSWMSISKAPSQAFTPSATASSVCSLRTPPALRHCHRRISRRP